MSGSKTSFYILTNLKGFDKYNILALAKIKTTVQFKCNLLLELRISSLRHSLTDFGYHGETL